MAVDSFSFGLRIIANGEAPALQGVLAFNPDVTLPAPTLTDTGVGPDVIAVAWLSGLMLSSTSSIGAIVVNVPQTAQSGQTYTIRVTGASATSTGTTIVNLSGGPDSILTIVGKKGRGQITSQ